MSKVLEAKNEALEARLARLEALLDPPSEKPIDPRKMKESEFIRHLISRSRSPLTPPKKSKKIKNAGDPVIGNRESAK